jgi:SAM-dependent methyltransferase
MVEKLIKELECTSGSTMLSLGCGNAMVEAVLAGKGYQVACVDAMPEAVTLARAKGLDALCADILQWAPDQSWPLVYLDGVLGHVYDPATGLRPLLKRIRSWLEPADGARYATLVASNDVTKNGQDVQAAPGVPGFHWLSAGYIHDQALEAGFDEIDIELFEYERPQSGNRMRVIVDARIKV